LETPCLLVYLVIWKIGKLTLIDNVHPRLLVHFEGLKSVFPVLAVCRSYQFLLNISDIDFVSLYYRIILLLLFCIQKTRSANICHLFSAFLFFLAAKAPSDQLIIIFYNRNNLFATNHRSVLFAHKLANTSLLFSKHSTLAGNAKLEVYHDHVCIRLSCLKTI